jgi:hypothetical protein
VIQTWGGKLCKTAEKARGSFRWCSLVRVRQGAPVQRFVELGRCSTSALDPGGWLRRDTLAAPPARISSLNWSPS